MHFDILTLFPQMFEGYLNQSLLKLAIDERRVRVELHDIRRWATDRHHQVDDRPFGGGPGMVLKPEPVVECVEGVERDARERQLPPGHLVLLSPQGRRLEQSIVEELAQKPRLVAICGRYEGFDQRIIDILQPDEISLGDFVLNGGEVAAMALIDSVIRLVPGVLGDERSSRQDSFSQRDRGLEFAQYTRPREYRGHSVPDVLLSGDHQEISRWRETNSLERTQARRGALSRVKSERDKR